MNLHMLALVADHLWQSTLFVLGVWILTHILKEHRAGIRHRLWLAASIKFLIPLSLLINLGGLVPWRVNADSVPHRIATAASTLAEPFASERRAPTPVPVDPAIESSRVPVALAVLWATGFFVSVAWWTGRWRRVRTALRYASPLPIAAPIRVLACGPDLEAGVFGILRPALLFPGDLAEQLTPEQLHLVLRHELCHVRRRDNLSVAIHMFVEAVFWFHPLLWWMKVRLIDEQERACDEEVLQQGGDPRAYAESILRVCECSLTAAISSTAGIAGANLKVRMRHIMESRVKPRLGFGRSALLVAATASALLGPIAIGIVQATTPMLLPAAVVQIVAPASNAVEAIPAPLSAAPTRVHAVQATTPIAPPAPEPAFSKQLGPAQGVWRIENPSITPNGQPIPDRLQLTFYRPGARIPASGQGWGNGGDSKSFVFDPSMFRGLTLTQIDSPGRAASRFEIVRDAGTFVCEGEFESGQGLGTFLFHPDPNYFSEMAASGFANISEYDLVGIALTGIPAAFFTDLHSVGIQGRTANEVRRLWTHGITADFIRSVKAAGQRVDTEDLISLRAPQ